MKARLCFYKRRLIILAVLAVLLMVLICIKNIPSVAEWMTVNIARWYIIGADWLLGWTPFSIYELTLAIVIVWLIVWIVQLSVNLFKKKWQCMLSMLLSVALLSCSVGVLYNATASVAYSRREVPLPYYDIDSNGALQYNESLQLAQQYIALLNDKASQVDRCNDGKVMLPSLTQMGIDIQAEYERVDHFDGYLSNVMCQPKSTRFGWIWSQMRIVGVFVAPFGEVNINGYADYATFPVTVAHEMAHSKGIMREDDANAVARYLLLTSDVEYLQYSALLQCVGFVTNIILLCGGQADYDMLIDSISPLVKKDIGYQSEFWSQYHLLADFTSVINDIYLKLSGVHAGVDSYNPPTIVQDSGEVDEDGNIIWIIEQYSPTQSIIVQLYSQGRLD